MSDKPKIYSFCNAGCKWESVHRDDFLASASHAPVTRESDGKYYLSLGKEYKIFADKNSDGDFACVITFAYNSDGQAATHTITHENKDNYADCITFRLLDTTAADGTVITLVYEVAGERYTETITASGSTVTILPKECIYVTNATEVFVFNADAEILATISESGGTSDDGNNVATTGNKVFGILKNVSNSDVPIPQESGYYRVKLWLAALPSNADDITNADNFLVYVDNGGDAIDSGTMSEFIVARIGDGMFVNCSISGGSSQPLLLSCARMYLHSQNDGSDGKWCNVMYEIERLGEVDVDDYEGY